jgi:hypothetical protein
MRNKTVRNGMRLVLISLSIIIVSSFYLDALANLFSLSNVFQARLYQTGIFVAATIGGYGVMLSIFGLILPSRADDGTVQILPLLFLILGAISLFFYLLASSINSPYVPGNERLRPGETITI